LAPFQFFGGQAAAADRLLLLFLSALQPFRNLFVRVLIASVGSLGDALPYVRLGARLQERGHDVTVFTNADHAALVRDYGLNLAGPPAEVSMKPLSANPALWHPIRGMGVLWRGLLLPSIGPLYATIQRMAAEPQGVRVLAGPHMVGARLAHSALGVPLLSIYSSPNMLRTHIAPTTLAQFSFPSGTPRWLLRRAWSWIDAHKLEPMARPGLNAVCAELGLKPVAADGPLFGDWMHAPTGGLTLYPEWFSAIPIDHRIPAQYGAFPIDPTADTARSPALAADLQAFLDTGPPPVAVNLGTAMAHAQEQYAAWSQAIERAGLRAVMLSGVREQLPTANAQRYAGDFAAFERLLPRCAALVHHGGIGSATQCLVAGVAQIITPHAHDQFENARCLRALGVAQVVARKASLAQRVRALAAIGAMSTRWRARAQADGLSELCERIESHPSML
jgi:rhamnosyltransferase subunit B